jgi:hypothetical protein
MSARVIERDERTTVVENASYRWSYLVLSFGLLIIVAVRSFTRGESPWDLLALVILGGGVNAIYQGSHGVLHRKWLMVSLGAMAAAVVIALAIVFARR